MFPGNRMWIRTVSYTHLDRNFVTICYRTYLNREPDAAGLESWLVRLNAGDSRDRILDGFIYSIEYGELCTSYGINR